MTAAALCTHPEFVLGIVLGHVVRVHQLVDDAFARLVGAITVSLWRPHVTPPHTHTHTHTQTHTHKQTQVMPRTATAANHGAEARTSPANVLSRAWRCSSIAAVLRSSSVFTSA